MPIIPIHDDTAPIACTISNAEMGHGACVRAPSVGQLAAAAGEKNVVVTRRRVVSLGVASSAGTHHAGQDQAPAALRSAGFLDRLRDEGVTVEDRGDLLHEIFVADAMASTARNLATVVRVARAVADAVANTLADGALPLILGGDCTIRGPGCCISTGTPTSPPPPRRAAACWTPWASPT